MMRRMGEGGQSEEEEEHLFRFPLFQQAAAMELGGESPLWNAQTANNTSKCEEGMRDRHVRGVGRIK